MSGSGTIIEWGTPPKGAQMTEIDFANFQSPAPHPGEHLRDDFMPEDGLTARALARAMGLKDRTRIERLMREKQHVTADTAPRLARVFGTTPQFRINLQTTHDLSIAAMAAKESLAAIKQMVAT